MQQMPVGAASASPFVVIGAARDSGKTGGGQMRGRAEPLTFTAPPACAILPRYSTVPISLDR